jgi:hypothetical protein
MIDGAARVTEQAALARGKKLGEGPRSRGRARAPFRSSAGVDVFCTFRAIFWLEAGLQNSGPWIFRHEFRLLNLRNEDVRINRKLNVRRRYTWGYRGCTLAPWCLHASVVGGTQGDGVNGRRESQKTGSLGWGEEKIDTNCRNPGFGLSGVYASILYVRLSA